MSQNFALCISIMWHLQASRNKNFCFLFVIWPFRQPCPDGLCQMEWYICRWSCPVDWHCPGNTVHRYTSPFRRQRQTSWFVNRLLLMNIYISVRLFQSFTRSQIQQIGTIHRDTEISFLVFGFDRGKRVMFVCWRVNLGFWRYLPPHMSPRLVVEFGNGRFQ